MHSDIRKKQKLRTSVPMHCQHVANACYIKCMDLHYECTHTRTNIMLNHLVAGVSNHMAKTRHYYLVGLPLLHSNW